MAEKTIAKKETKPKAAEEKKVDAKVEVKPEIKSEAKPEVKKETKAEAKKEAKVEVKKKYIPYTKKENKKKSQEVYDIQKKLSGKKHTPVFRGRFGKKNIRRKSIEKWDKWRKPHGIDLDKGIQHGFRPKIGYRRSVDTRHIHPSGFKDVLVCNMNDLEKINPKNEAARIAATIGKRKRNAMIAKANEKGIWVLN